MKESICIKNFVGIQDINIELKQLNIFIGPQGSGKSVVVKLIYFCKGILDDLGDSILKKENLRQFKKAQESKFKKIFPEHNWSSGKFSIQYHLNDIEIVLESKDKKIKLDFSSSLVKIIHKTKYYFRNLSSNSDGSARERALLYDVFKREIDVKSFFAESIYRHKDAELEKQIFIPAGRSFFANLQANIFSFLSANQNLDPFLVEFGSIYERCKDISSTQILKSKNHSELDKICQEILNSYYVREKNKDYLLHSDKRKVNLSNASSGQQEVLPLIIILKLILIQMITLGNKYSLYIEEPEAHLFPTAQYNIVRLLARLCNLQENNTQHQIFITTHSPYLLSSFNNLFYAGSIIKQDNIRKRDKVYKIIDKKEIIFAQNVAAYLLTNEKCESLINESDGLVSAEALDKVSEIIGISFENLLAIDYSDDD